jgi:DNA-directed RNA polymerase specialized sigma subunit
MSRPHALTPAQQRHLRRVKAARRELIKQLKALPTRAELARSWKVSETTIGRYLADTASKCTSGTIALSELFL